MACEGKKHTFHTKAFLDFAKGGWSQIRACDCGIGWVASRKDRSSETTNVFTTSDGAEFDSLKEAHEHATQLRKP